MPPTQSTQQVTEQTTQTIEQKLEEQSQKIDAIYTSIEKMRKSASIALWVTVLTIILPLGLLLVIGPSIIEGYSGELQLSQ